MSLSPNLGQSPSCFEPALVPALLKKPGQKALLSLSGKQTGTEFTQHRKVETRISEFEAEPIFPINAASDRLCCLPIGKIFHELEDRDQG
jgi:hypothetical protein